jgi:thiosulfate/3-mercaptopyruvate sulfurtransferase
MSSTSRSASSAASAGDGYPPARTNCWTSIGLGVRTVALAATGERYRGDAEPVDAVAGHIPGAVSAPTLDNVRQDGTFKDDDDLRARLAALSRAAGRRHGVGVYCGSGVTAAHEVLALERAGIPAALYVGSWSNWITDPARPVATGPDPG